MLKVTNILFNIFYATTNYNDSARPITVLMARLFINFRRMSFYQYIIIYSCIGFFYISINLSTSDPAKPLEG